MRFIFIFTILLSGCSIIEDPSEGGGLVSTTTNIVTGSYDERLQKRQEILDEAKTRKQNLGQNAQQLESEKLSLHKQVNLEKQKLNRTDANIKTLEAKLKLDNSTLKSNRKDKARKLQQLKKLKSRNKKLQQQINVSNSEDAIKSVQDERNRLDEELSLLLEVSQ